MNNWLNKVQPYIYPYTCFLCGEAGQNGLDLCAQCQSDFATINHCCTQCGIPLASNKICGACLKTPPHFDKVNCLYQYQNDSGFLIQKLKFQHKFTCAKTIGLLMARHFKELAIHPDVLIPIPLHKKRVRQRGFNQSFEIAKSLQTELDIRLDNSSLKRIRDTSQQASLNAVQRRKNIKGAFQFTPPKNIDFAVLLDDVVTTGSTVNEAAKILKQAGIKRVEVWAFARA